MVSVQFSAGTSSQTKDGSVNMERLAVGTGVAALDGFVAHSVSGSTTVSVKFRLCTSSATSDGLVSTVLLGLDTSVGLAVVDINVALWLCVCNSVSS